MSETDFASLLCSRLCHDIVSPVGAVNNGLEILKDDEDGSMREPVMELIEQSAMQTSRKLQFFRLAFGTGGGLDKGLPLLEAKTALSQFFEGSKVQVNWDTENQDAPKYLVKLLLCACLMLGESVVGNGELSVSVTSHQADDSIVWSVTMEVEGKRIIVSDLVRAALAGKAEDGDATSKAAPAFFAGKIATSYAAIFEDRVRMESDLCTAYSVTYNFAA